MMLRRCKWICAALWLTVCLGMLCTASARAGVLTLPAGLEIIEEEAFAGNISLDQVVVPQGTRRIESQAFADCENMTEIYLPDTIEYIAEDAFLGSEPVVYAPKGSYAWKWAINGYYWFDWEVTAAKTDRYTVTWEPIDGISQYCVWVFADETLENLFTTYYTETNSAEISTDAGTRYYFRVGYLLGDRYFYTYTPECVKTADPLPALDAPQNLSWYMVDDTTANIAWDPVPGAAGYRFYISYARDWSTYTYYYSSLEGALTLDLSNPSFWYYLENPDVSWHIWVSAETEDGPGRRSMITLCGQNVVSRNSSELYDYTLFSDGTVRIDDYTGPADVENFTVPAFIDGAPVTRIGMYVFYYKQGLTGELTLPETVTEIGDYAFGECDGLTKLTVPGTGVSIGQQAFYSCDGLTQLNISGRVDSFGSDAFAKCSNLQSVVIAQAPSYIGNDLFWDCVSLTDVSLPEGLTEIGYTMFANDVSLTGLVIPETVTRIGGEAFADCTGLSALTIPDGVTYIGANAFWNCSGLTGSLTIPNGVTYIGYAAFYNCSGLTGSLIIPDSVTHIGNGAFENCSGFTGNLNITGSLETIGNGAFENCSGLESVSVEENITAVPNRMFCGCERLVHVTLPGSVNSIGYRAFYECSDSLVMTVPDGSYAMDYCIQENISYELAD